MSLLSKVFILGSGTILAEELNPAEKLVHWRGHTQTEGYLTPSFPCECNLFFMSFSQFSAQVMGFLVNSSLKKSFLFSF